MALATVRVCAWRSGSFSEAKRNGCAGRAALAVRSAGAGRQMCIQYNWNRESQGIVCEARAPGAALTLGLVMAVMAE